VGASSAPVLAASAAPASAAPAASAPVRGVWLPARELPGTSLSGSSTSSVDAVACAPGAECVTADDTWDLKTGTDSPFLLGERNGDWGKPQQIPGLAALAGRDDDALIASIACPASGYCLAVGFYGFNTSRAFVAQETKGAWGKPTQIPHLNAMDTARAGMANLVSCPSVGNCTVAGEYGTGNAEDPVMHAFVASEASGHWHDAAAVPGLDALTGGGEAEIISLSCASAADCALAGTYSTTPPPTEPGAGPSGLRDQRGGLASTRMATQLGPLARFGLARPQASSSAQTGAFVAGEVGGKWGDATVPVINGLTSSGEDGVTSVACPAAGDCIAAGFYYDSASSSSAGGGFLLAQDGTGWSAPTTNSTFVVNALTCSSVGNCTAAGGDLKGIAAVQREEGGVWRAPAELPGIGRLTYKGKKAVQSTVIDLTCPSAGNYSVIGLYGTSSAATWTPVGSFFSEVNGAWQGAQVAPGLAALSSSGVGLPSGLACASAANCLAGGLYSVSGAHGGVGAFELTELPARVTGTLIGLSAGTVVYGREQAERVSVKVTAHLEFPPGRVVVWAGPKAVCAIALKSGKGSCLLTAKELGTGTYHLVARYSASAPYLQSTSGPKTLVVKK
jgi:hypothetical protein